MENDELNDNIVKFARPNPRTSYNRAHVFICSMHIEHATLLLRNIIFLTNLTGLIH